MERVREYQIQTHHLFVDFRSAYDSIQREDLYQAMKDLNVPVKLIRLVKLTMSNIECMVQIQGDLSEGFTSHNGVRQGDSLACLLFNIGLEKAIRESKVQTSGTIFNHMVQILGYADDIDIIGRSKAVVEEAFLALDDAARKLGLVVNTNKTKYMVAGQQRGIDKDLVQFGHYSFERVQEFVYLGSQVNTNNDVSAEIRRRIASANRCYFGLRRHLGSSVLSRSTKTRLYKTLIRPVLIYASETWALSKSDERDLQTFERKILRRIYGPVKDGSVWRRRTNREVYSLIGEPDVGKVVRIGRLRWAGHIARMGTDEIPNKLLNERLHGTRPRGRPKLRWSDGVEEDSRTLLGVRNWRAAALNRANWRKLLEQARTQ